MFLLDERLEHVNVNLPTVTVDGRIVFFLGISFTLLAWIRMSQERFFLARECVAYCGLVFLMSVCAALYVLHGFRRFALLCEVLVVENKDRKANEFFG